MAGCYDRMGRSIFRRNYESALALAPREHRLLGAFASSLDMQGLSEDAAEFAMRSRRSWRIISSAQEKVPLKIAQVVALRHSRSCSCCAHAR